MDNPESLTDSSASAGQKQAWKSSGPPDIQHPEITYLEKIGGGCFGSVYRGKCRGKEVAVKKLFKQDLDETTLEDFKKEVEIMSQLRHPNVLLFMGACTDPGHMAIVTELLPGGNMEQVLRDKKVDLSLYKRVLMALDVAQGMSWLHGSKPQIIHRDLKPSNLLVDESFHVKVCDFGLSAVKENETGKLQDTDSVPGTPLWMAPEVLMGKPFDASSDVYSFGVCLWEMLTQEEVYPEFTSFGAFKRAICYKHHRPTIPAKTEPSLAGLMERCWHREPSQRPSFVEVIRALENIAVDVAISDPVGNEFWKQHLLECRSISFDKFKEKVCQYHSLPFPDTGVELAEQFLFLQHMLAERRPNAPKDSLKDIVTLEGFGKLLQWFGPMGKKTEWLQQVHDTMRQAWFFGDMDSRDAEKALSDRKKGTFLVRMSASYGGQFTISKVSSKGITHERFTYKPAVRTFTLKTTKGAGKSKKPHVIEATCTLEEFIRRHLSKELGLQMPCPGSPFAFLSGKQPPRDKGASNDGYVVCDDSDEKSE